MFDLPPPNPSLQVEVATTGMASGIAQTRGPQLIVSGGLDFTKFSLAAYAKNVASSTGTVKGIEAGLSINATRTVAGFQLNPSILVKRRFGMTADGDATEVDFGLVAARTFAPFTASATVIYTNDLFGAAERTLFLDSTPQWQARKGTALSGSFGRRIEESGNDYTAFNLGVTQSVGRHIQLDLRWYDTAQSELGYNYRGRVVAYVRMSF
jgi:hypothetical protein